MQPSEHLNSRNEMTVNKRHKEDQKWRKNTLTPRTLVCLRCLHTEWAADGTHQICTQLPWHLRICSSLAPRFMSWCRENCSQKSVARRWQLASRRRVLQIIVLHTSNRTCDWLRRCIVAGGGGGGKGKRTNITAGPIWLKLLFRRFLGATEETWETWLEETVCWQLRTETCVVCVVFLVLSQMASIGQSLSLCLLHASFHGGRMSRHNSTPAFYSVSRRFEFFPEPGYSVWGFSSVVVLQIPPRPLPFQLFAIHCWLIIIQVLQVMWCVKNTQINQQQCLLSWNSL